MTRIKYSKELLQDAVLNSTSYQGVMRYLGLRAAGGTHAHLSRRVREYEIDTSHFTGGRSNVGKPALNRKTAEEILIILLPGSNKQKSEQLRRALIEIGVKQECAICSLGTFWNGIPIQLEVDHINGEWLDNRKENLRFICPNCHSQQETSNRSWKYRVNG